MKQDGFILNQKSIHLFFDVIICIFFFNPWYFGQNDILDILVNAIRLGIFGIYLIEYLYLNRSDKIVYLYSIIFGIVLFSTIYNGDSAVLAFTRYFPTIAILMLVTIRRNSIIQRVIKPVFIAAEILIIINTIFILMFPNGYYVTERGMQFWFLGQKQEFVAVYMPALFCCALLWDNKKYKKRIVLAIILMVYTMLVALPLGLLLAFGILGVGLLISQRRAITFKGMTLLTFNGLFECIMLFVAFNYQNLLRLQGFLGTIGAGLVTKAATIAARVRIWNNAIDIFERYSIAGAGVISQERYSILTGLASYDYASQFHNMGFDLAATGGIIAVIIYVIINIMAFRRLDKSTSKYSNTLKWILFTMNVLSLTEVVYISFCAMMYSIAIYVDKIQVEELNEKKF